MHAPPGGARFYRRSRGTARPNARKRALAPRLSRCLLLLSLWLLSRYNERRARAFLLRDAFTPRFSMCAPRTSAACSRARSRNPAPCRDRDTTRPPIKTRRIACTRLPLSRGCVSFTASRHRSATTSDLSQVEEPLEFSAPSVLAVDGTCQLFDSFLDQLPLNFPPYLRATIRPFLSIHFCGKFRLLYNGIFFSSLSH